MGGSKFNIFALLLVVLLTSGTDGHRNRLTDPYPLDGGACGILKSLGYSSKCVAAALAVCSIEANNQRNKTRSLESVVQNVNSIQHHLQNIDTVLEGLKETQKPRSWNCADLRAQGDFESGVRTIYPYTCCPSRPVTVYCDQSTDGGGWTVIQRRDDLAVREDFYRTWSDYVLGFGNITGEYWLGLDNIFALTNYKLMEVRFDLDDFEGEKRFAKYKTFRIEDSSTDYVLHVGRYEGDAGNSFFERHNGMKFSTWNKDNDGIIVGNNCAMTHKGAFWYGKCHHVNINGLPHRGRYTSYRDGINWYHWHGFQYSLKKVTMKIKPVF